MGTSRGKTQVHADVAAGLQFLMLSYRIPAEPSKIRVSVWREIKKQGAVYLQDGVCVLPRDTAGETGFRDLSQRIRALGGDASLLVVTALDQAEETRLIAEFNAARDKEYRELLEQCGHFQKEIAKETRRANFSFAEVEEIEADLEKLQRWLVKVSARDRFSSQLGATAGQRLRECEEALALFAQRVYEHEAHISSSTRFTDATPDGTIEPDKQKS